MTKLPQPITLLIDSQEMASLLASLLGSLSIHTLMEFEMDLVEVMDVVKMLEAVSTNRKHLTII